ncbi:hypothetical protein AZF37_04815 [endosymbiont 'TC1' of Trimyema compressum]|uniref:signal peptidase I n=1 Tax=endosymbiont 'TC1' of Trimyema compressum TaxID=243899 RepID=UPI0007F0D11A|nr:signal peptidase I [endosymbiont 'TC1' of Trimyema compressum]AMP20584.1 hypothetical protein AZF37_04815 [endosymbiont 'TC1' of Trimyema compressum]
MHSNDTDTAIYEEKEGGKSFLSTLITLLQIIAIALIINAAIKAFLLRPYTVISGSMEPTLMVNDKVFAEVVTGYFSKPQRDDIVVFVFPGKDPNKPIIRQTTGDYLGTIFNSFIQFKWPDNGEVEYVKRVIGTPGDVIDIRNGKVYVNGSQLDESSYIPSNVRTESLGSINFPYTVPDKSYFVLGDNRENSFDSRYWGPVPEKNIIGKPVMLYFPFDHFRFFKG